MLNDLSRKLEGEAVSQPAHAELKSELNFAGEVVMLPRLWLAVSVVLHKCCVGRRR